MSNALQDQLLKAGLTTEKKIKKQIHSKNKQAKQNKKKKNKRFEVDESKLLAQKAEAEKKQHDRELNRKKEDAVKQKAIISQIKQLIETNSADISKGELAYNFEDTIDNKKVIKKLFVTEAIHDQISRGKFAIAKFGEQYAAVPAIVANKIKDRDESYIIVLNEPGTTEDIDDEYADYQIPDDLMW